MGWFSNFRKGAALFLAAVWVLLLVGRVTSWRGYAHLSGLYLAGIGALALSALWSVFGSKRTSPGQSPP
jgi:hypothetical protein